MHMQQRTAMGRWHAALGAIWALVVLAMVTGPGKRAWALDDEATRATLRGLSGVEVGVDQLATELTQGGVTTQQVQTAVQQQLHRAGIPVFTSPDARTRQNVAYVAVTITTLRHETGLYAYSIDLAVYQDATLLRDPTPRSLLTWWVGSIGMVEPTSLGDMVKQVDTTVDQFIQAYRAVNPRARAGSTVSASRTRMRQVQERLRAAGFPPGPLDGQQGPQTLRALRHYQHAKGLRITGTLDPQTIRALGLQ